MLDINHLDFAGCSGKPEFSTKNSLVYTSFDGHFTNTRYLFPECALSGLVLSHVKELYLGFLDSVYHKGFC